MKDFDMTKYLRENRLGSYGILNHYVDLKPLKEEGTGMPYEGPDPKLDGFGDEYEQAEAVSEGRMDDLVNQKDLAMIQTSMQRIFDALIADGFEPKDVEKFLTGQVIRLSMAYQMEEPYTSRLGNLGEAVDEDIDPSNPEAGYGKFNRASRLPRSIQSSLSVNKVLDAIKAAGITREDLMAFVDAVKTDPDALPLEEDHQFTDEELYQIWQDEQDKGHTQESFEEWRRRHGI